MLVMTRLMKDELFEAQLLRAIGYAPYGGADAGECLAVAGQITGTSLDSWHDAWTATAARLFGRAEASAAAGETASARSGFFRAANYFRTAGLFAMGVPADPRLAEAHRREVDSFPPEQPGATSARLRIEGLDAGGSRSPGVSCTVRV
jgi:hypothetical protein